MNIHMYDSLYIPMYICMIDYIHCIFIPPFRSKVVYTPQRKSARRLGDDEIIYDDEQVSQLLLNDPNAAFIANPVRTREI